MWCCGAVSRLHSLLAPWLGFSSAIQCYLVPLLTRMCCVWQCILGLYVLYLNVVRGALYVWHVAPSTVALHQRNGQGLDTVHGHVCLVCVTLWFQQVGV